MEAVKELNDLWIHYDHLFKILIVGDSGVGKTCLLNRFVDNSFNGKFLTTIGIDFKMKIIQVQNVKCKLQIWDSAGNSKFASRSQMFYKGAVMALFAYDVTSHKSFRNLENWIQSVEQYNRGDLVIKAIVACKCDKLDSIVTREEAELFAHRQKCLYYETDSFSGTGISEMFLDLSNAFLECQRNESIYKRRLSVPAPTPLKRKNSLFRRSLRKSLGHSKVSPLSSESTSISSNPHVLSKSFGESKESTCRLL